MLPDGPELDQLFRDMAKSANKAAWQHMRFGTWSRVAYVR